MLPYPIDSLGRFVAKVVAAEIAAEEKDERDGRAVRCLQLVNLGGLFLATLVGIREVACGFGLDQDWESAPCGAS